MTGFCANCKFQDARISHIRLRQGEIIDLLDKLKEVFKKSSDIHSDLNKRTLEISQLQQTIGQLQVFLFSEREENLRLAEENDRLKIENYDHRKSFEAVVKNFGIKPEQLRKILSSSREDSSRKDGHSARPGESSVSDDFSETSKKALTLQVQSLKTQLDNLHTIFRSEIDVLLKDREVVAEERLIETKRLEKELQHLAACLMKTKNALTQMTEKVIAVEEEYSEERKSWIRERQLLEKCLDSLKQDIDHYTGAEHNLDGGSRTRLSIKQLQDQIAVQTKNIEQYQRQSKHYEAEMKKWRKKAESLEITMNTKCEKLTNELSTLRIKYDVLDRRRLLESSGFQVDIKQLREKLKDLEKKFNKVKSENSQERRDEDEQYEMSTKQILQRAKLLEKELASLKLKINDFDNT